MIFDQYYIMKESTTEEQQQINLDRTSEEQEQLGLMQPIPFPQE